MVRKLFKHELIALLRLLLPVELAVLGVGVLFRVLQFFESDHIIYQILFGLSVFGLIMVLVAGAIAPLAVAVSRFYKNLFTAEGYLTMVLPVTPAQHLWVKLLSAMLMLLVSFCVSLASAMIAASGELLREIWLAAKYLLRTAFAEAAGTAVAAEGVLLTAEVVLYLIISSASSLLLPYACTCIGQLARKNRVLVAVGVYFAHNAIMELIVTVISMVFAFSSWENIESGATFNMPAAATLGILLIIQTALAAVYFLVSYYIIRNKLNLE